MVQQLPGGHPLQHGGYFPPRDGGDWQRNEKNPYLEDTSLPLSLQHQHKEATTVERALIHCARVPVKRFALIVQKENGEEWVYSSKSLVPYQDDIFTEPVRQKFRASVRKCEAGGPYSNAGYSHDTMYNEFEVNSSNVRKHSSGGSSSEISRRHRKSRSEESDEDGSMGTKRRRRAYLGQPREKSNEATPIPPAIQKQTLVIGNGAEVEKFYTQRFKDMQQSACKVMGKAFVKLVEPKKQTHHPYTKGNDKAPPWWPNTEGENNVRHREPDHLLKPERTRLLVHILRMIVEPVDKQCATVRKLKLNVKLLENATMEAMSNWFADKDHPENEAKRPFLKEIFKVARLEERFKAGEIDDTTKVPVSCGDSMGHSNEESDSDRDLKDEEEEDDMANAHPVHIPTPPESLVSPTMGQPNQFQQSEAEQAMQRMRPSMPIRQYTSPMENIGFDDQFRGITYHQQPHSPNNVDLSRRTFASPVYPNQQQSMYWSNTLVTSGPAPTFYTTSPQASLPSFSLPPPVQHQSTMAPTLHNFNEGIPNRYDIQPAMGNQLRTGSLGHPNHQLSPTHHTGFQDFLNSDNGGFSHQQDLKDDQHQPNLHHQQN